MGNARIDRAGDRPYRFRDLTCAAAALVILMPILLALALLILWRDGRPVLFSQQRVGKNGKLFRIWKFRTMRAGSRGAAITAAGDPRLTPIGAVLRRWKLDELPQLFNVLRGDMSLVGPRPEMPEFVRLEEPVWQTVLQARPGLTDLATLLFRDEEKLLAACADPPVLYRETILPAKLGFNVAYLDSRSFWSDFRLICLTARYTLLPTRLDPALIKRAAGMEGMS